MDNVQPVSATTQQQQHSGREISVAQPAWSTVAFFSLAGKNDVMLHLFFSGYKGFGAYSQVKVFMGLQTSIKKPKITSFR